MIKLRCPVCMWMRNKKGEDGFPEMEEGAYFLINHIDVYGGGGKGSKKGQKIGFFINKDKSLTLEEAKDMPEWKELIEQLREKAKYILDVLKDE